MCGLREDWDQWCISSYQTPTLSTLQLLSLITLQSLSSPPSTISAYDILSPSTPHFTSLSITSSFMLSISPPLWIMQQREGQISLHWWWNAIHSFFLCFKDWVWYLFQTEIQPKICNWSAQILVVDRGCWRFLTCYLWPNLKVQMLYPHVKRLQKWPLTLSIRQRLSQQVQRVMGHIPGITSITIWGITLYLCKCAQKHIYAHMHNIACQY